MTSSRPGTFGAADNNPVQFSDALTTWVPLAHEQLRSTASQYNAVITYKELASHVQEASGVRTRMLLTNWVGKLLEAVAVEIKEAGEPPLTSLAVRQDGTIGPSYANTPKSVDDEAEDDLELYAAKHRLLCYQQFAPDVPSGGGTPTMTPKVQQARARAQKLRRAEAVLPLCPSCFTELPMTGTCHYCP